MENLNDIIFYTMDKSIKSYRQFAQKQLKEAGFTITIDQWLVLKAIEENNAASQNQIAERVFKDVASITRIIELLVQKNYLTRDFNLGDRRRFRLALTDEGHSIIKKLHPYTRANRDKATEGISKADIEKVQQVLSKIIKNVS